MVLALWVSQRVSIRELWGCRVLQVVGVYGFLQNCLHGGTVGWAGGGFGVWGLMV